MLQIVQHTQYGIVSITSYLLQSIEEKYFFREKREAIRGIIKTLCDWKGVEIIEGEVCADHVHLLLAIPTKMSISSFVGYLKGKSSIMLFQRFGNMKFAYRNREFWCKGYYVDTVGKNIKAIKDYISNQLKHDQEEDQLSLFDPSDPFNKEQQVIFALADRLSYAHLCAASEFRAKPEKEKPLAMLVDIYCEEI